MRLFLALLFALPALADDEPVGRWRFTKADRPVKVVVLGGSIGAWPSGSFADYLSAACPRIEVRNISKTGYGAPQLRQRYRAQVLRNPGARPKDGTEHWLLHSGGLNSIGSPSITIKETMQTFLMAREAGVKVIGFSLTPWGKDQDRRWRDFAGIAMREKTLSSALYLLGKLPRHEALGAFVEPERKTDPTWGPGELPDVAVDLYDSDLRAKDAPARDVDKLGRLWDRNRALQRELPDRAAALEAASLLPQWFLRKELHSFDHIHPNGDGHRQMAAIACPALPITWGCDCPRIPTLTWVKGQIVPASP